MFNLLESVEIRENTAATATGTTTINGAAVQCLGESVAFMCSISAINAGNYICIQGSADGSTGWVDLAGTRLQFPANDKPAIVEVVRPTYAYVRPSVVRAGATATITQIFQFRYEPLGKPVTNTVANAIASETNLSPIAGTA